MKKRSQSGVITAVLLIVIVIVAVIIVWNVVYNIMKKSTDDGDPSDVLTVSMEIKKTKLFITGGAQVNVYRGVGEGTITGLKFIFENKDGKRKIVQRNENFSELTLKTFNFTNSEIGYNNSEINKIYIVPVLGTKNGNEVGENSDAFAKDVNGNRIIEAKQDSGLISWWKLDGNFIDSVSNFPYLCNPSTGCPTFTSDRFGQPGMAGEFTGKQIQVSSNELNRLGSIGLGYSITGWMYYDSASTATFIIEKYNPASLYTFAITSWSCGIYNGLLNPKASLPFNTDPESRDKWVFFSCVIDNDITTYINGNKYSTSINTLYSTDMSFVSPIYIVEGTSFFKGKLDNLMIFNKSLNAEEIANIYANQK